jgi:small subunit ribosomal protein S17
MAKKLFGRPAPDVEHTDKNCPFHGALAVKPEFVKGKVVKKDFHHTATIEWERQQYIKKYERYEIRRSRVRVHNPQCIDAKVGDLVLAARCRPLSKAKHHVIIKVEK